MIIALGNPTRRILEDKLRILRAIRFASKYDFRIEDQLWIDIKRLIKKLTHGGILILGKNETLPGDYPEFVQNN